MKKTHCVIIALILSLSLLPASALAKATTGTEAADELYRLGLFRGTGTDALGQPVYDLDKPITRLQSVVMLIRLLGEEDAALACTDALPFSDVPEWGRQYVAYAYNKGYTKGMSATVFSPELQCTSNMYLTLVLRSLGYNDSQGDFAYEAASTKAAEVGIASENEYSDQSKTFYRDDCVLVSTDALSTPLKGSDEALISSLVKKGAVSYDALSDEQKVLVSNPPETPTSLTLPLQNGGEIGYSAVFAAYPQAAYVLRTQDKYANNPLHKSSDIVKLLLQEEYYYQVYFGKDLGNYVNRSQTYDSVKRTTVLPDNYILVLDSGKNLIAYSPSVTESSTARQFSSRYLSRQKCIDELNAFAEEKLKPFGSYSFRVTGAGPGWDDVKGQTVDVGTYFIECTTDIDMSKLHIWCWMTKPVDATNEATRWSFVLDAFYFQNTYYGEFEGHAAENYALSQASNLSRDGGYGILAPHQSEPFDAFIYTDEGSVIGYVHIVPSQYK